MGGHVLRQPFMPDEPCVVDSTGALAFKEVPKRMLILGGGGGARVLYRSATREEVSRFSALKARAPDGKLFGVLAFAL